METSEVITLVILAGFIVFLIILGITAYRVSTHTEIRRKFNTLNSLLYNIFTTNNCAETTEDNSGEHIKFVDPYLNDNINLEFITRKCGTDD